MRTLKYHLPIALLSGLIVAAVLHLSAWYNLRDATTICRRQGYTRMKLSSTGRVLEEYHQQHGDYPESLQSYDDYREAKKAEDKNAYVPGIVLEDEWGRPFQYTVDKNRLTLSSFGRDGRPGGIGLDADLYHDARNHEETLATFRQFFKETDPAEVDRRPSKFFSLLGGGMIAFSLFFSLCKEDLQEPFSVRYLLLVAGVVVTAAIAIGLFLLPLHVPSGH